MKKIIYRVKATGKISHDGDYDAYLRTYKTEKAIVDGITKFNESSPTCFAEIIELDEVAEFYAREAEQHFSGLDDIADRLRRTVRFIEDIARDTEGLR